MVGRGDWWFFGFGVWDIGSVPELVLLSTPTEAEGDGLSAAGCGRSDRADAGWKTGYLWVSADSCSTHPGWDLDQPQDRVAYSSAEGLAFLYSDLFREKGAPARGAGECAGAQPEMGIGHHRDCGLEWGEGAFGGNHRLCGPHGSFLAVWAQDALGRVTRDGSGGRLPAVRVPETEGPKYRVLDGQRAGVRLSEAAGSSPGLRDGRMPYPSLQPRIQRAGRGLFWKLQTGLCLPGGVGEPGAGGPEFARMDRRLQSDRPTQRPGDEISRPVLCRLDVKNQANTCPKLGGAVQIALALYFDYFQLCFAQSLLLCLGIFYILQAVSLLC